VSQSISRQSRPSDERRLYAAPRASIRCLVQISRLAATKGLQVTKLLERQQREIAFSRVSGNYSVHQQQQHLLDILPTTCNRTLHRVGKATTRAIWSMLRNFSYGWTSFTAGSSYDPVLHQDSFSICCQRQTEGLKSEPRAEISIRVLAEFNVHREKLFNT
jgi:hypothetical protein